MASLHIVNAINRGYVEKIPNDLAADMESSEFMRLALVFDTNCPVL
jgi:hypothetical protein